MLFFQNAALYDSMSVRGFFLYIEDMITYLSTDAINEQVLGVLEVWD
jgi:hypothetical protein